MSPCVTRIINYSSLLTIFTASMFNLVNHPFPGFNNKKTSESNRDFRVTHHGSGSPFHLVLTWRTPEGLCSVANNQQKPWDNEGLMMVSWWFNELNWSANDGLISAQWWCTNDLMMLWRSPKWALSRPWLPNPLTQPLTTQVTWPLNSPSASLNHH